MATETFKLDVSKPPSYFSQDKDGNSRLVFDLLLTHKWHREKLDDKTKYAQVSLTELEDYAIAIEKEMHQRGIKIPDFKDSMPTTTQKVWSEEARLPKLYSIEKSVSIKIEFIGSGAETDEQSRNLHGDLRKRSSTLINGSILINVTPDHEDWFKEHEKELSGIIFSHAHNDAFAPWFRKYKTNVKVYATRQLHETLREIERLKELKGVDIDKKLQELREKANRLVKQLAE